MNISENSKRIAKNTLFLYVRMLFIMGVTLYTSRIILETLGVKDYGIYNVVGGIVTMLSFFNNALSGAGSRFITYALGSGDVNEVKKLFSTILCLHLILAILIIVLGETIGLWFVLNKLVIPSERLTAAIWVYHCSVLTTVVSILSIPYNSLIIAHERMGAFAYISIVEVILKLIIVWGIVFIPYDKLIVYAMLYLLVQIIIRLSYSYYCSIHFSESVTSPSFDRVLVRKIVSYAGWTVNGNLAIVGYTQGLNILLNLFFGPVVNAARGIAVQVQAAIMTFVQNFQTAVRPQIIKSYANSDFVYLHTLVIMSSKYGFFLMLILTFPVIMCIHPILKIWLGIIPDYTDSFVCIMLLTGILAPFRQSLINAIHATGDIKKFQIYEGTFLLSVLPISYLLLKFFHISPQTVLIVYLLVEVFTQYIRTWIVLPRISMPYIHYLLKVILPALGLLPFGIVPFVFISIPLELSLWQLCIYMVICIIYIVICIYIFGLGYEGRTMINHFFKDKILCNLKFR